MISERSFVIPNSTQSSTVSMLLGGYTEIDPNTWPVGSHHSRRLYQRLYLLMLLLTDAIALTLAFVLAYWLRFTVHIALEPDVIPHPEHYTRLALVLVPLWLLLFGAMHLYDMHFLLGGTSEYANALNACTSGMMVIILVTFLVPEFVISRSWLVLSWLLAASLVCSGRFLLRRMAYQARRKGLFVTPAVIVGTNEEAAALAYQLRNSVASGLAILGFVEATEDSPKKNELRRISGVPVIGSLTSLPEIVAQRDIEEVIIASTAMTREQLVQIPERLAAFPQVEMRLSSGLYEIFTTGMRITTKNAVPLMSLNRLRLDRLELGAKMLLDYSMILVALPFLFPLFALIAAMVKLDSPGPIFYRRRVLGVSGKEFDALKFRTMAVNGDEILAQYPQLVAELQANHKLKVDPRITRVGHLLRKTSLDELPQLINVLLGEMSLVGPRMISPEERLEYGQMQLNLLTVKPGLTGLWQVSGRSELSYADRVQLDMHYIRNYSIWLDLQILFFQTLPAVLKRTGAY